jgi:hypothetical protein
MRGRSNVVVAGRAGPSGPKSEDRRLAHAYLPSKRVRLAAAAGGTIATCALSLAIATPAGAFPIPAFLSLFNTATLVASTVPSGTGSGGGDVNPYGIVNVQQSTGALVAGDTLVSNFNAVSNLQGTGTTIVQISPGGQQSVFAQINAATLPGSCVGGVGLTTALTILSGGFVVVGSLPVTDEGDGTPEAGCLIVLNSQGVPVETWSGGGINGPWDMTAAQFPGFAELFVTNVLNGTVNAGGSAVSQGTVLRILVALPPGRNPVMLHSTTIGTGFAETLNSSALVLGPTGVALGFNGSLYVADTVNNRIATIPFALLRTSPVGGGGLTLTSGNFLEAPLGMTLAPNGDIIVANGGNGDAVEVTPFGQQIDNVQIDPLNLGGDLFGLTIAPGGGGVLFVDDGNNDLYLFSRGGHL